MIWLLAALDLVAGVYLLRRALPRQRRDLVVAVAVILLVCAATLVGIGAWQAAAPPEPVVLPPGVPGTAV